MNRWVQWILIAGWAAAIACAADGGGGVTDQFEAANRLTAEGRFTDGVNAYDAMASTGNTSAALEYNRAQALLKAGQVGAAWAHLQLANRLAPRDTAIRLALDQLSPRIPGGHDTRANAVRWMGVLTLNEWAGIAMVSAWVFGALLFAHRFAAGWDQRLSTPLRVGGGVFALTTVLLGLALWNRWHGPDTIVVRPDATVRVSPLDEARTAFSLAEGSGVRRQGTRGEWVMIEEPVSRRFGWIKQVDVQVLPFR